MEVIPPKVIVSHHYDIYLNIRYPAGYLTSIRLDIQSIPSRHALICFHKLCSGRLAPNITVSLITIYTWISGIRQDIYLVSGRISGLSLAALICFHKLCSGRRAAKYNSFPPSRPILRLALLLMYIFHTSEGYNKKWLEWNTVLAFIY